ncbi:unnamed protein product [Amoebophrya sp. A120]|nr:unnamed protein product [Amoebophrya sp. A120]|eukprot:GSA120T00020368001.1
MKRRGRRGRLPRPHAGALAVSAAGDMPLGTCGGTAVLGMPLFLGVLNLFWTTSPSPSTLVSGKAVIRAVSEGPLFHKQGLPTSLTKKFRHIFSHNKAAQQSSIAVSFPEESELLNLHPTFDYTVDQKHTGPEGMILLQKEKQAHKERTFLPLPQELHQQQLIQLERREQTRSEFLKNLQRKAKVDFDIEEEDNAASVNEKLRALGVEGNDEIADMVHESLILLKNDKMRKMQKRRGRLARQAPGTSSTGAATTTSSGSLTTTTAAQSSTSPNVDSKTVTLASQVPQYEADKMAFEGWVPREDMPNNSQFCEGDLLRHHNGTLAFFHRSEQSCLAALRYKGGPNACEFDLETAQCRPKLDSCNSAPEANPDGTKFVDTYCNLWAHCEFDDVNDQCVTASAFVVESMEMQASAYNGAGVAIRDTVRQLLGLPPFGVELGPGGVRLMFNNEDKSADVNLPTR